MVYIYYSNTSAKQKNHSLGSPLPTQHIHEHTRARGAAQPSVLDLVFTADEHMIDDVTYESPLGKSDHCTLRFRLLCYADAQLDSNTRYLYHRGNFESMREELNIDWDSAFAGCPGDQLGSSGSLMLCTQGLPRITGKKFGSIQPWSLVSLGQEPRCLDCWAIIPGSGLYYHPFPREPFSFDGAF